MTTDCRRPTTESKYKTTVYLFSVSGCRWSVISPPLGLHIQPEAALAKPSRDVIFCAFVSRRVKDRFRAVEFNQLP